MGFWGIEVKPGRPVTHKYDPSKGKLHVSQAALGLGSATNKSVVQCIIGEKIPVILCVLLPDKMESCGLDLEFQEPDDDVIISVIGPRSVFLTGYFPVCRLPNFNDSSESYGVDIGNSDGEQSIHSSEEDSCEDSFINDDEPLIYSSESLSSDIDKKKPKERKADRKRLTKRYMTIESEDESVDAATALISTLMKSKAIQGKGKSGTVMSSAREVENGVHDVKTDDKTSVIDTQGAEDSKSNKRRKEITKEITEADSEVHNNALKEEKILPDKRREIRPVMERNNAIASSPTVEVDKDIKRKKKRKKITQEKEENEVIGVGLLSESGESKLSKARTLSNGMIIEDIAMGNPDGKTAALGKKVKLHYVGKLRDDGNIVETNIGKPLLKFRLGAEGVPEGWNIGLDGMRVGGKRRVTIPPTMRGASQEAGVNIPSNSWLVYEFELARVR